MKTIKGPAIFLAQFMGDQAPFDTLANLASWAASLGYKGIQVPADPRLIDLDATRVRLDQAVHHLERGGLARARAAEQH